MATRFTRLTRTAIKALAPGEWISEHGAIAERLKNGDIRYSVDILCDGQRIHRVVGRESEGVTRAQVEAFIEQAKTDARNGRLNLPKGRKTALRFTEAADAYIERLRNGAGSNINRKERHLALHLKTHFGSHRLDRISEFAVQSYRKARRDAGAADGTINRELSTLSHLLRSAVRWGWIKRDDVPQIDRAREGQGRITALSEAQCRALMDAAIADQDPDLWIFVAIGLGTGMRHSEICAIRWEHIDFDRRRIFVPFAKAGSRDQPMPADLAAKLAQERTQRAESEEWVFPGREGGTTKGHRICFAKGFRRAVIAAGLDDKIVTPHVMRHTAVTRLVRSGADIPTIMKISGHKTVSMVLRYAHVDAAHIDAAASALELNSRDAIHPKFTTPRNPAIAVAS